MIVAGITAGLRRLRRRNPAAIPATIILDWFESMMVAAWQYRINGTWHVPGH